MPRRAADLPVYRLVAVPEKKSNTIRTLGLPSARFFRDIGFVKFRVTPRATVAELVM